MPNFVYEAIDARGGRVRGALAAASEQAALAELEKRALTPVVVESKGDDAASARRPGRVGVRALGESYQQVGDLLRAGVPLLRALKLMGGRKARPALAAVYQSLAHAVERGSDLATAMAESPGTFPPVHVAMVRAGEKGGFLEDVMVRLGKLVRRQADLNAKIVGNMIYPLLLAGVGGLVLIGIFVFLMPLFRPMFSKLPGGMPLITQLVFAVSDALTRYGLVTLIVLVAAAAGVRFAWRREDVRDWWSGLLIRLKVVGPVVRSLATARLCQLLGAMLANGVPLLAALQIAKDGVGNRLMSRAVEQAAEAVKAGQHLAPPLAQSGLIDDDVVEMIAVGEAANNLDEVLLTIGDTIEERLDRLIGVAVRLIEPLLLLVIALVVGVVAAALLLPMSRMGSSV